MSRRMLGLVLCALSVAGCAGARHGMGLAEAPPPLSVSVLRPEPATGTLRLFESQDVLSAQEAPVLELRSSAGSYITAVHYADAGSSYPLVVNAVIGDSDRSAPLRVAVPRRAPPGVTESELRIVVVASHGRVSPDILQLLRLPCTDVDRRGDPVDPADKKTDPPKETRREPQSDKGKPSEGKPRGGELATAACDASMSGGGAVAVRVVVLRSQ